MYIYKEREREREREFVRCNQFKLVCHRCQLKLVCAYRDNLSGVTSLSYIVCFVVSGYDGYDCIMYRRREAANNKHTFTPPGSIRVWACEQNKKSWLILYTLSYRDNTLNIDMLYMHVSYHYLTHVYA